MTDTNRGFGYPLGASWTPQGRTSAPTSHRDVKPHPYFQIGVFAGLVVFVVLNVQGTAINILAEPTAMLLAALGAAIDEYRKFCWQARRIHDIGQSARVVVAKRIPVWIALLSIVIGLLGYIGYTLLPRQGDMTNTVFLTISILVAFSMPLALFIYGHIYFRRVLQPFNEFLYTARGDAGANAFGPSPDR